LSHDGRDLPEERRAESDEERVEPGVVRELAVPARGCTSEAIAMPRLRHRLLAAARAASGATTDTDTVRLGLEAILRHAAYERLRALRGSEPGAKDPPRRREKPTRRRSAA
jgi:hypothetical protein